MQILYQKKSCFSEQDLRNANRIPATMSIINDRFKYQDGSDACGWVAPTMGDADGSNGLVRMAWENR